MATEVDRVEMGERETGKTWTQIERRKKEIRESSAPVCLSVHAFSLEPVLSGGSAQRQEADGDRVSCQTWTTASVTAVAIV